MNPTSLPKDPAQPDAISYPLSALAIVKRYTLDEYRAAFGDPPPPDPNLPYKDWFDTSASTQGEGAVLYCSGYSADGTPTMMRVPAAQARVPNYPAKKDYPAYAPTATPAVYSFLSTSAPVDPLDLSTRAEADLVAKELGGSVVDFTVTTGMRRFVANGETRREYAVLWPDGSWELVGNLLAKKNRFGVGAPVVASGHNWEPNIGNGTVAEGDPVPVPLRQLLPNEEIVPHLMGDLQVVRKDKVTPLTPTQGSGGGLTTEEHNALMAIFKVVVGQP
jgi:hypothetical protein